MEMFKLIITYLAYWTLLVSISVFIHLFWLSPKELKRKFIKLFPHSKLLSVVGYVVIFILMPFTLPKSFIHLIKQIYKTYKT